MTSLLLLLLAAHGHHHTAKHAKAAAPASDPGIEKALATHQDEVQRCYEFASTGAPKALAGKVALHWFVTADGEAARMSLDPKESTLTDESLVQCLEDKLSGWSFPTSDKGQPAAHTWSFGAKGASAPVKSAKTHAKKKRGHRR